MQQAIIDIACGISVNITPQKDRAISQGNSPRGQYSDEAQRGQRISFLLACAFLLFHSVTAFHYLPNRRYTFGNVKVTVVPPYELFLSSTVINKSVAIF